jgi:hypothetical protein
MGERHEHRHCSVCGYASVDRAQGTPAAAVVDPPAGGVSVAPPDDEQER